MLTIANIAEKWTPRSLLTNPNIGRPLNGPFDRNSPPAWQGQTMAIDSSATLTKPDIGEKMMLIDVVQHQVRHANSGLISHPHVSLAPLAPRDYVDGYVPGGRSEDTNSTS